MPSETQTIFAPTDERRQPECRTVQFTFGIGTRAQNHYSSFVRSFVGFSKWSAKTEASASEWWRIKGWTLWWCAPRRTAHNSKSTKLNVVNFTLDISAVFRVRISFAVVLVSGAQTAISANPNHTVIQAHRAPRHTHNGTKAYQNHFSFIQFNTTCRWSCCEWVKWVSEWTHYGAL